MCLPTEKANYRETLQDETPNKIKTYRQILKYARDGEKGQDMRIKTICKKHNNTA
jgi:hypothetical protein